MLAEEVGGRVEMILPVVSLVSATTVRRMGHSKLLECTNWGEVSSGPLSIATIKAAVGYWEKERAVPCHCYIIIINFFFYQTVLVDVEAFLDE